MQMAIIGVASLVVLIVSTLLVLHQDYEDGLIGRVGLALMAMAAMARFAGVLDAVWHGHGILISHVGIILWVGLAIFLTRHAYRFMSWRKTGKHEWKAAAK